MDFGGRALVFCQESKSIHKFEKNEYLLHFAVSEYAFGASRESILRKYGIGARELETAILQTSAMPVLDSSTLSALETALLHSSTKGS